MNPKTTGILFLVAAALAAFVYLYEIRGEEGRRAAEEFQRIRLLSLFVLPEALAILGVLTWWWRRQAPGS